MNPSCREVRRDLPAFAATDLEAASAARVRAHLVACNACRIEAATAARAARALATAGPLPARCDDAFFTSLHATITAATRAPAAAGASPQRLNGTHLVAASVLFAAGLALSLLPSQGGGLHARPPIRIAADLRDAMAAPPGPGRATMLPLGQEQWLGPHHGLMGRLEFRTLEQFETEGFAVRPPSQDQSFRAARRPAPGDAEPVQGPVPATGSPPAPRR